MLPHSIIPFSILIHSPAISDFSYRAISQEEIGYLEAHGNVAVEWWRVFVRTENTLLPHIEDNGPPRIVRCYFYGDVFLHGNIVGYDAMEKEPLGLFDSTLVDCMVTGRWVKIVGNKRLSNVVIEEGAEVVGNGIIEGSDGGDDGKRPPYSCGHTVRVGSEVLGRPVVIHPNSTMQEVLAQAFPTTSPPPSSSSSSASTATTIDRQAHVAWIQGDYLSRIRDLLDFNTLRRTNTSLCTIIGRSARVRNCPLIKASFIGPFAVVENSELDSSAILTTIHESTYITGGSIVERSIVQPGVKVSGHAIVRDSLLMEHSSVETEGKCSHVVACPDSGVATGECHHSLLGPFVGFHHQSLLIAALWPKGRGNVAYGAKIGSNHTGRAADQECLLGEGVFFGLGSLVKLPVNLSASPYTLVAADTTLEQQRLHFPFSLVSACRDARYLAAVLGDIMKGGSNSSSSSNFFLSNVLRPAWVLRASPYTVLRNEAKFMQRSKSQRHKRLVREPVFRPEIVDVMIEARARLRRVVGREGGKKEGKEGVHFTAEELEGAGANIVTWRGAEEGLETYTEWIKRYALRGLYDQLVKQQRGERKREEGGGRSDEDDYDIWWHQRSILRAEYGGGGARAADVAPSRAEKEGEGDPANMPLVSTLLQDLVAIEERVVKAVEASKRRDGVRGAEILDDYAATRPPLEEDKVIMGAKAGLAEMRAYVEGWLEERANDTVMIKDV
jgi:NDP-sugar pyrophosphorylase family protein